MEEGERRGKEKKLENGGRPQDEFRRSASLLFFPLFSNSIGDGVAGLQEGWLVGWLITRLVGGFIVT